MIKTVSLTADTETKVEISGGYNVGVINRTTGMLYASRNSGIIAGADDVAAIPAGDSYVIRAADDTVYLLATAAGDVQLESIGAKEVFRIAAARSSSGGGEGGTVDDVARQAIASHANNEDIHLTVEDAIEAAASVTSNPNLLINPNFKINQRGKTEYSTQGYTVDRWHIWNYGTVTVTDDGVTVTAGEAKTYFKQVVEENLDNMTMTLSVETADGTFSATGTSDDVLYPSNKKVMGVAIGEADLGLWKNPSGQYIMQFGIPAATSLSLKDVKLEIGGIATLFTPPDPAVELLKCQRYYQIHTTGDIDPVDLRPSMNTITDIKQRSDGNYEYIAEL